jgi:hypothetical protein
MYTSIPGTADFILINSFGGNGLLIDYLLPDGKSPDGADFGSRLDYRALVDKLFL